MLRFQVLAEEQNGRGPSWGVVEPGLGLNLVLCGDLISASRVTETGTFANPSLNHLLIRGWGEQGQREAGASRAGSCS